MTSRGRRSCSERRTRIWELIEREEGYPVMAIRPRRHIRERAWPYVGSLGFLHVRVKKALDIGTGFEGSQDFSPHSVGISVRSCKRHVLSIRPHYERRPCVLVFNVSHARKVSYFWTVRTICQLYPMCFSHNGCAFLCFLPYPFLDDGFYFSIPPTPFTRVSGPFSEGAHRRVRECYIYASHYLPRFTSYCILNIHTLRVFFNSSVVSTLDQRVLLSYSMFTFQLL